MMIRKIFLVSVLILTGCMQMAENHLDLTVMQDNKPVVGYEMEIRFPVMHSKGRVYTNFDSRKFIPKPFKTDESGKISLPMHVLQDIGVFSSDIKKPMLFIRSKDIKECDLVLWHLEDKKFFIPMKHQDDNIEAIKYLDDVTGDFVKMEKGWDITAVIHRLDRICEE